MFSDVRLCDAGQCSSGRAGFMISLFFRLQVASKFMPVSSLIIGEWVWREARVCVCLGQTPGVTLLFCCQVWIWCRSDPSQTWSCCRRTSPRRSADRCASCISLVKLEEGCGFNSQGTHTYWKKRIAWMHCKSLWIKAPAKYNVHFK